MVYGSVEELQMKKELQALAVIIFCGLVLFFAWNAGDTLSEGGSVRPENLKQGEEEVQPYWTLPVKNYEVSLYDLIPRESMQLVMKRNGTETVVQTYEPELKSEYPGEYAKPGNYQAVTFENLLGHDGFCVYREYEPGFYYADYYAIDGEEENAQILHLAATWGTGEGTQRSRELEDYLVDLDGDGDRELVATVQHSGDGGIRTFVYYWENGRVMRSDAAEPLDEWKTKDYEFDMNKLRKHAEVFCESKDALPLGIVLWQENQNSSIIQENEEYIYVCGRNKVVKINKKTNESVTLWESEQKEPSEDSYYENVIQYDDGCGLLAGNHIYFLTEEGGLATIQTDGTGYRQITVTGRWYEADRYYTALSLQGGTLYVKAKVRMNESDWQDKVFGYYVNDSGELLNVREINRKELGLPANCESCMTRNEKMVTEESKELFGRYLLCQTRNPKTLEYNWIWYLPGEEATTVLNGSFELLDYNAEYLLFRDYEEASGSKFFYLVDAETLAQEEITLAPNSLYITYVGMDEEYLYSICEEQYNLSLWRVSIEGGESECMYTFEPGYFENSSLHYYDMIPMIQNGYLYYVGEQDYAVYLMRRSMGDCQTEEILGEALYDTGIGAVGELTEYEDVFYSGLDSDIKIAEIEIACLKVNEKFAGAGKINACMQQYMDEQKRYIKGVAGKLRYDEDAIHSTYAYYVYSFVNEIPYFDGKILSFYQSEEEYQGGGYWTGNLEGFTFDIETGERLKLQDIIANSEKELKEIVGAQIDVIMRDPPDEFILWENAVSVAKDIVSLDSTSFYLSKEGIHFCFEEEKLSLAGYTEDILIPYEAFELKFTMEKDA